MLFSANTAEDGSFLLDDDRMRSFWNLYKRDVLFIHGKGYKVSVIILEPGQRTVNVTLQSAPIELPEIPVCTMSIPKGFRREGSFVRVTVPKNMKIKRRSNFEYAGFTLTARNGSTKATLRNWMGVYSSTYPSTPLIIESKTFDVSKNGIGLDWKGQKADGTYWRYIGGAIGMIDTFFYETSSEILAKDFDEILNTMCIEDWPER